MTLCQGQIQSLTNQATHSSLSAAKSSRDSGLSSGDPSPNTSQSPSAAQSPTSTVLFDQLLSTRLEGAGGLRHHINRSQSSDASGLMCRAPKRLEARSSKYMLQRTRASVSCRSCCPLLRLWSLWHLAMGKTLLLLCRVALSSTLHGRNGFSHSGRDIFFLLLSRCHAESPVCKMTVAAFSSSSLLP